MITRHCQECGEDHEPGETCVPDPEWESLFDDPTETDGDEA